MITSSIVNFFSSHNPRDQRDAYRQTVSGIMGKLEVKDSDCLIVEVSGMF